MHTNGAPKEIKITFTEEDRQKAEVFTNGTDCLVATALKRMGHKNMMCYTNHHYVDGYQYICPDTDSDSLCYITIDKRTHPYGPYYHPQVVGRKATLTLV